MPNPPCRDSCCPIRYCYFSLLLDHSVLDLFCFARNSLPGIPLPVAAACHRPAPATSSTLTSLCCTILLSLAVPDLPYNPRRWRPQPVIMGERYKGDAARARAHAAAAAHSAEARTMLHKRYAEAAVRTPPGQVLQITLPTVPVPEAASPEEQTSRHEGPVRAVRWHPTAAVLASGSQAVGVWRPPLPGAVDVDMPSAATAAAAAAAAALAAEHAAPASGAAAAGGAGLASAAGRR